jgi:hypothetical protein
MILLSLLLLSATSPTFAESAISPPTLEIAPLLSKAPSNLNESIEHVFPSLIDSSLYFGAGAILGSASLLGGISWGVCQLSPWASTIGNECLLANQIFGIAALHSFAQAFKRSPFFSFFFKGIPSSYSAWNLHKKMLSQIPTFSKEDQALLHFLQKRWLAKATGCFPFLVDWMCPSFGISFQVHPETTNSYARDPATKFSQTYKNRVEAWKQFLPHPHEFPLILTRPSNIRDYLPLCFEISQEENIQYFAKRLTGAMHTADAPWIVDLTSVLPNAAMNQEQWLDGWHSYENQFSKCCNEHKLDLNQILCIQRVQQQDLGIIRILPFISSSKEKIQEHYRFLLEWVSRFGLSANRIELDRSFLSSEPSFHKQSSLAPPLVEFESKEQWISLLNSIDRNWRSNHPQKTLMFEGTLQILKNLGASVPQEKWQVIMNSPTCSCVVQLSFTKIKHQLQLLIQEQEELSFHNMASRVEQIHADLTSLLEIFMPFTAEDFRHAFQCHLTCIPQELQTLTGYGIHSSAMTSLGGIFKAVEKSLGRPPCILYGENAYFECIQAAERISKASSTIEATEQDWKEVDLILAQFNPTVKRINFKVTEYQATEYHVEKIAKTLDRALAARNGKPLSIALDCTLDFSNSARVSRLLVEFQKEIERGDLNVVCYRSGLKFDLFGMDNYCGAPFFMIHNQDAKWSFFDSLLTDPALQTDHLSINWFCIAYQHAAAYLESYRKQIFDNTRAVLNQIPARLFNEKNPRYRVIPVEPDADPSFIDIKIFGPLHAFRGDLLVGVFLTIKCMEAGYPLLYRPGIGFYHPNLAVLFGKECTTVRLTVGLDPAQIDVIVQCMKKINTLN